MLSISNKNITETLDVFKKYDKQVTFLVPTETAISKSIIDATHSVRDFLKENKIHDYHSQKQGEEHKKISETFLFSKNEIIKTKTSFYRPHTKNGDPRIWIYNLSKYSKPTDLLALMVSDKKLIVINCSSSSLENLFNSRDKRVNELIKKNVIYSQFSNELLNKCKEISKLGFVKTIKAGDTGVGLTFENLCGIKPNSSGKPDYKGIEIKTSRNDFKTRDTLFSKVPNWNISNLKSSEDIVEKRGKPSDKYHFKVIFNTISAIKKNSHDLRLDIKDDKVLQVYQPNNIIEEDVAWLKSELIQKLEEKHKETFWIKAITSGQKRSENESFHYKTLTHTGSIDSTNFFTLLETGDITLDYLLWVKIDGWQNFIKKKGYDFLWKIKPKHKKLLFKFHRVIELND